MERAAGDSTRFADTVEEALERARPAAGGGAWVRVTAGAARRAAAEVDGATPLAGWPVAVKDLIAVAGVPMQAGTRLRAGAAPEPHDAPVVAALREAGAIVLGTVALHEIALGVTGVNELGTPENPRRSGHAPGGSSSGSAVAVADGSARLALATDTGGSSRIPAALCGVVGFKPAFGTYSIERVLPLAPTLDHVGLIAAGVEDVRRAHGVLAEPAGGDVRPGAVGLLRRQLEDADPQVAAAVEEAIRALAAAGYRFRDVDPPGGPDIVEVSSAVLFHEAAQVHAATRDRWERDVQPDVRGRLLQGAATSPERYREALARRAAVAAQVRETLAELDLLVGPTVPIPPPTLDDAASDPALPALLVTNTRVANVTGLPALSLPVTEGSTVGLHLLGAANGTVLAHAARMERVLRRAG